MAETIKTDDLAQEKEKEEKYKQKEKYKKIYIEQNNWFYTTKIN